MRLQIFAFITVSILSCKAKDSTTAGLEEDLNSVMQNSLYKAVNYDSSNVKYKVEKVLYFDDVNKGRYVCDFTVHMKAKLFDTTGTMRAYISKDLKTVQRVY